MKKNTLSDAFQKGLDDAQSIKLASIEQEAKQNQIRENGVALLERIASHIRSQLGDGYYARVEFGTTILVGNGVAKTYPGANQVNLDWSGGFRLDYIAHNHSVVLPRSDDIYSTNPFTDFEGENLAEFSKLDHLLGTYAGLTQADVVEYLREKRRRESTATLKKWWWVAPGILLILWIIS